MSIVIKAYGFDRMSGIVTGLEQIFRRIGLPIWQEMMNQPIAFLTHHFKDFELISSKPSICWNISKFLPILRSTSSFGFGGVMCCSRSIKECSVVKTFHLQRHHFLWNELGAMRSIKLMGRGTGVRHAIECRNSYVQATTTIQGYIQRRSFVGYGFVVLSFSEARLLPIVP